MDKENVVYNGILFSHEKNEILSFVTTGDPYLKWNKPDTERQILHDLIHTATLKKRFIS
jgi:hypothetical protein